MEDPGRLDSWKQIAAYLGKSERTVRRWQETEGLPVHRHVHQQRGTVWAYRSELDEWLQRRLESPEPPLVANGQDRRFWSAAALLFAVAILAGGVLPFRPGRESPPLFQAVQITAVPGNLMTPSFSPSGHQIVFHWTPADGPLSGLFVKTLDDDNLAPLVTTERGGDEFVYSPAWSPDGSTIAFLRRSLPRSGSAAFVVTSETWLCLVAAAGGPERRIVRLSKDRPFMANDNHLSWAPDGQFIYAPMNDPEHLGIYRISVTTGEAMRVTPGQVRELAPALSPDGRVLAFKRREGQYPRTIEQVLRQDLTADGKPVGEPRELYSGRSVSGGLAWLPSGKELIFCTGHDAFFVAGNRLFRLPAEPPGQLIPLATDRECSTLAVSRPDAAGNAALVEAGVRSGHSNMFRAALRSLSLPTPVSPSSRFDGFPSHSPDGSAIAFISNRSGQFEIWVARRGDSAPHRLTMDSQIASAPRWSPDGSRLVFGSARFDRDRAKIYSIHTVAASGGELVRVPVAQATPSEPVWSPDGAWIYYWSGFELWRTRPDGREATKVGEYPSHYIRSAAVAGDSLFYVGLENSFTICRVPLEGGASERFADGVASMFFAVSRKFVYYRRQPGLTLVAHPVDGGPPKEIGLLPETDRRSETGSLSVSPDDAEIVWVVGERPQADLYLARGIR